MTSQSGNVRWSAPSPRRQAGIEVFAGGAASPSTRLQSAQDAANSAYVAELRDVPYRLGYQMTKRVVDVLGAIVLAMVFLPIMLVVLVTLKRGGNSAIFGHTRIGKGGVPFTVYKFRTMVPNADVVLKELLASDPEMRAEWARDHKLRQDPRITKIGVFLRKTSLDELPQLWNVLKGEMSLVGPRPIVSDELIRYGRAARYYLVTKPGITGLWQVTGRNDTDYHRRIALDRHYAQTASLLTDLIVLFKTVGVILFRRGAY